MTICGLQSYLDWFYQYTNKYVEMMDSNLEIYQLKIDHSLRVLVEAQRLAFSLNESRIDARLIHLAALLHDIGRFTQMKNYGTLSDIISTDHGIIGVKVLKKEGVLDKLNSHDRGLVLGSISIHNRRCIPANLTRELDCITRVLRDADKIDILGVTVDKLNPNHSSHSKIYLNIISAPEQYSSGVLEQFFQRKKVRLETIRYINDYIITVCSWIYDLNFKQSLKTIIDRRYLETLANYLPNNYEIRKFKERLESDLDKWDYASDSIHIPG